MRIRKLSYESKPFLPNTSIQRSSNRFCTDSGSFFFPSVPRNAIKGLVDLSDDPNAPTDVFK